MSTKAMRAALAGCGALDGAAADRGVALGRQIIDPPAPAARNSRIRSFFKEHLVPGRDGSACRQAAVGTRAATTVVEAEVQIAGARGRVEGRVYGRQRKIRQERIPRKWGDIEPRRPRTNCGDDPQARHDQTAFTVVFSEAIQSLIVSELSLP